MKKIAIVFVTEVTETAAQLQAVMQKNPRKARLTCTREFRQQKNQSSGPNAPSQNEGSQESMMVCEISDDEDECPSTGWTYLFSKTCK